jgi:excisionase family DNA binding protein
VSAVREVVAMSPTPTLPIENLWKVDDVAKFLSVKRTAVYERVRAGELPHLRVGNLIRFVPDQVRAWALKKTGPSATVVALPGGRR